MCLATANITFLALTARKGRIETDLSIYNMRKLALTQEMSELSRDYNSKLNQKSIVYYDNGKPNRINYGYLMGYYDENGQIMATGDRTVKKDLSMVLTDSKGLVVLSDKYAEAILRVVGSGSYSNNQGGPFDKSLIPEILSELFPRFNGEPTDAEMFKNGIQNYTYNAHVYNAVDPDAPGEPVQVNGSDYMNELLNNIVSFYYPILLAAATNGWTTEYSQQIQDQDYMENALASGIFCLASVDEHGYYENDVTLTYYAASGELEFKSDSDKRETIKAWYDEQKNIISAKETNVNMLSEELSTELEAIKVQMESLQKIIDDAIQSTMGFNASS